MRDPEDEDREVERGDAEFMPSEIVEDIWAIHEAAKEAGQVSEPAAEPDLELTAIEPMHGMSDESGGHMEFSALQPPPVEDPSEEIRQSVDRAVEEAEDTDSEEE